MVNLHLGALELVSSSIPRDQPQSHQALVLLASHGINLFTAALSITVRGQFDISGYLLRGLFDCSALLYATASKEERAEKFFANELLASQARKLMVHDLSRQNAPFGNDLSIKFLHDSKAANQLTHAGLINLEKLVERTDEAVTPVVGGRADPRQTVLLTKAAVEYEYLMLLLFRAFRESALGADWLSRFARCGEKTRIFMAASETN